MMDRSALTPRRQQILVLWLVGHTYAEMVQMLKVNRKTITGTLYTIKTLLGLYSTVDLFLWAWREGLIDEWAEGKSIKAA